MDKLPAKNIAIALLFCVILGPVGLLYASFWGGVAMILLGIVVVSSKLIFPIILLWLICCVWGVRAVDVYNRRLVRLYEKTNLPT